MVRGSRDVPFVRQYIGTTPFFYYIEMQMKWGMGPALGLLAFTGFGWAIWRALREVPGLLRKVGAMIRHGNKGRNQGKVRIFENLTNSEAVVIGWTLPFFVSTGMLDVKFMRYLMPLTPFLMVYGAAMLLSWSKVAWRQIVIGVSVTLTALFAFASPLDNGFEVDLPEY